jgi:hypothetical protein
VNVVPVLPIHSRDAAGDVGMPVNTFHVGRSEFHDSVPLYHTMPNVHSSYSYEAMILASLRRGNLQTLAFTLWIHVIHPSCLRVVFPLQLRLGALSSGASGDATLAEEDVSPSRSREYA